MKNLKYGFTLSEMVVTILLMSFLLMIMMSNIKNAIPNQEKIMLRKAYQLTETIVSQLVNDIELYPEFDDNDSDLYLANTVEVTNYYSGENVSGDTKFCELFKSRLNVAETTHACNSAFGVANGMWTAAAAHHFTTTDGMTWYVEKTDFNNDNHRAAIYVDVNGIDKGVNCIYKEDPENLNQCGKKPDRFLFYVYANGRVEPFGNLAKEYLKDSKLSN